MYRFNFIVCIYFNNTQCGVLRGKKLNILKVLNHRMSTFLSSTDTCTHSDQVFMVVALSHICTYLWH